jgi:hypothetical protein
MTIRVWNGAQLRRSIRAGMRLRTVPPVPPPAGTAAEPELVDIDTSWDFVLVDYPVWHL